MPRFIAEGFVYHTISVTKGRRPLFADADNAKIVIEALDFARGDGRILILAFAIMPDHMHLVLAPQGDSTLNGAMKQIKSFSARRINSRSGTKGPIWQQSFFDRVIRSEGQLQLTIDYIHRNPVEEGLVVRAAEFIFSSAHPYAQTDIEGFFR